MTEDYSGKITRQRDENNKLIEPYRYSMFTGLRIPHFYAGNFYVYKYAIGQVAGLLIADRIKNKVPNAIEDYKKYLSSGTSLPPLETIKLAGIDLSNKET
jgi:oligoendopeptidase F